jgi:hypothetical protein
MNYEAYERMQKLQRPDEKINIGYNVQDPGF